MVYISMIKKFLHKRILPSGILYYRHRLLAGLGHTPILVYTMGKVGSSTVYHTLRKHKISRLVYHIHFLTDSYLEKISKTYNNGNARISDDINIHQLLRGNIDHISSSYILKKVCKPEPKKKWKIITLVRDPVATFFSHIFQNPATHRPELLGPDGLLDIKRVNTYVWDHYNHFNPREDYISNWFDKEFYEFTGVDLYDYDYETEAGYQIIQNDRFDIAVLSLESLDKNFAKAIGKLTNSNKFISVIKQNVREKQKGANAILYKELKQNIVVSKENLQNVYSTRYAKHFFSPEFREKMIEKWSKPR